MFLIHWRRALLAVALVLASCKSNTSTAATPDAGIAAAPAPSKAPAQVPASGPALAYLKPVSPERCAWIRQPIPTGEPVTLFTFDTACDQSEVSWSPSVKEGLVLSSLPQGGERIWRVDFAQKSDKPMDLKGLPAGTGESGPRKPGITRVGFDAQGRPVALVYVSAEPEEGQGGEQFISFEGQRYPVTETDSPVRQGLALAYRWEGSEWKRFETKVSGSYTALDANNALYDPGPSRTESLPGQETSKSTAQLLNKTLKPKDRFGKWMALPTPGGTLLYRAQQLDSDGSPSPSGPVRWEQNEKLVELEGLKAKPGDTLVFQLRNDLLVINVLGETQTAYVFDSRTKKNLTSVTGITAPVTLWPEPSKL